ncbi:MAG: hypothetical protein CV087_09075 [Candidatus Brocadia sp. WS118]|nr:MAG: hypothetical protein CV087_09075 [Candidatus Brocadia sp. WS118]
MYFQTLPPENWWGINLAPPWGISLALDSHNHPTGEPAPSIDDLDITRELIQAGEYLKIPVLDHIIIGHDDKFVSMLRDELLDFPQRGARKMHENDESSQNSGI